MNCLGSLAILIPWLGQDFFPTVDSGSFKLHLRAPTGMRIEETANLCDQVERWIRGQIPASEFQSVIDNVGLPYSGINLSYSNSAPVGTSDADILVTLAVKHHPTDDYIQRLRLTLPKQFPGATFAFLPADMVSQILNFGLPAPIDVQIVGNDLEGNHRYADALLSKLKYVTGTADLRIQQPFDQPYLRMRVERTKAEQLGFTAHDIAQNLLVSLSGSFQTSPTFWVDPKNRVSYQIATQTPQYRADTLQGVENIPITGTDPNAPPSLMASFQFFNAARERPRWDGGGFSLQRRAGSGHLWLGNWTRSGWGVRRHQQNHRCESPAITPWFTSHCSWTGADHASVLRRPSKRTGVLHRAGLSADRGQHFPILAGSLSSWIFCVTRPQPLPGLRGFCL